MGVEVPVMARFSTTVLETGSSDGVEDMRGFAVKFYTQDGNYDLLMLNIKAFNIRDPILFPSIGRSRMRHPETFVLDPDTYWDFTSLRPEVTFGTLLSFSDAGRMKNYREMKGFALNTFKWTGGQCGESVFVRYHMLPDDVQEPVSTSPSSCPYEDPDHFRKDLYHSIKSSRFPTWTLNIQIMTPSTSSTCTFDPFDPTKIWPEKEFPLIPVGTMTLNQNPSNFAEQIEKVAFHPGNLIPGVALSPDRVLHGRIFAYSVAQRHRLGRDFNKIPVNCPLHRNEKTEIFSNRFNQVKYFPSSFNGISSHNGNRNGNEGGDIVTSDTVTRPDRGQEDNYRQIDDYWRGEMSPEERLSFES
ncbi:catalase [Folsomia candida]|uniref:catalase n=1 Tax=Folsomia candida TaxID=158441 RepID=UPI001604F7E7|nr:catalase [Folsomia candida]